MTPEDLEHWFGPWDVGTSFALASGRLSTRCLRLLAVACARELCAESASRSDTPRYREVIARVAESVESGRTLERSQHGYWVDVDAADAAASTAVNSTRHGKAVLREVAGYFWEPWSTPDYLAPWRTPDVLALAARAYDGQDFTSLPILADALEEAGCTLSPLLWHLRGREVVPVDSLSTRELLCRHHRGCWALDLILGKE